MPLTIFEVAWLFPGYVADILSSGNEDLLGDKCKVIQIYHSSDCLNGPHHPKVVANATVEHIYHQRHKRDKFRIPLVSR